MTTCPHPIGARAVQPFNAESPWAKNYQVEQCYDCGAIWVGKKNPYPSQVTVRNQDPELVVCNCDEFPYTHTLIDHIKLLPETIDA